jgi:hypothetical protein
VKRTDIEWTDLSSNPLQYRDRSGRVVWACVKHSSGCAHCYSETIANHYQRGKPFTRANMEELTPFLDEKELKHILTAQRIDKRPVPGSRCFLGDMNEAPTRPRPAARRPLPNLALLRIAGKSTTGGSATRSSSDRCDRPRGAVERGCTTSRTTACTPR